MSPFGGRIADRRGPIRSAVLALVITVPCIVGYGLTGSIAFACVLALVHSVCDAVTTPAGQAAVARGAPPSLAAAGQGLYGAVGAAAAAFAAFGAAPLYGAAGPRRCGSSAPRSSAVLGVAAYLLGRGTTVDEPRSTPVSRDVDVAARRCRYRAPSRTTRATTRMVMMVARNMPE